MIRCNPFRPSGRPNLLPVSKSTQQNQQDKLPAPQKRFSDMSSSITSLKHKLSAVPKPHRGPVICLIDGFPGAGKSYFARELVKSMKQDGKSVAIFAVDDFLLARDERRDKFSCLGPGARGRCNGEELRLGEYVKCLSEIAEGRPVTWRKYCRSGELNGKLTPPQTIQFTEDYLIVEGTHASAGKAEKYSHYKIFIGGQVDMVGYQRYLRDTVERGADHEKAIAMVKQARQDIIESVAPHAHQANALIWLEPWDLEATPPALPPAKPERPLEPTATRFRVSHIKPSPYSNLKKIPTAKAIGG